MRVIRQHTPIRNTHEANKNIWASIEEYLKFIVIIFKYKKMKTPKQYMNNLKNHIITEQMVSDALYSYNKRAKNYRDKEREYREIKRWNRYWYDKYNYIEKNREKKESLYQRKDEMLRLWTKPTCIHRLKQVGQERIYDYDYEDEYFVLHDVIKEGSYWDNDEKELVSFKDVRYDYYLYFLYYEFPDRSFHTPIEEDDLNGYSGLEIRDIDSLVTKGKDINELLPLPFCDKILAELKILKQNDGVIHNPDDENFKISSRRGLCPETEDKFDGVSRKIREKDCS